MLDDTPTKDVSKLFLNKIKKSKFNYSLTFYRFIKPALLVLAFVLASSNGFVIDCVYATGNYYQGLNQKYSCRATITTNGNPDITTVTGNHNAGKTLNDVQIFILGSNSDITPLYKFPSNFATVFPGLIGIMWTNTKMRTISAADLQQFPNLVYLNVGSNFLTKIDGDLFKYNPHITSVDFSSNFIRTIDTSFLDDIPLLTAAYFMMNRCYVMTQLIPTTIGQYSYFIANLKRDLDHVCGPRVLPNTGACSANCTSRFDAIESEVSAVEARITAPWYEKLKWFFRTVFGL